jgi:hypothetical protein
MISEANAFVTTFQFFAELEDIFNNLYSYISIINKNCIIKSVTDSIRHILLS